MIHRWLRAGYITWEQNALSFTISRQTAIRENVAYTIMHSAFVLVAVSCYLFGGWPHCCWRLILMGRLFIMFVLLLDHSPVACIADKDSTKDMLFDRLFYIEGLWSIFQIYISTPLKISSNCCCYYTDTCFCVKTSILGDSSKIHGRYFPCSKRRDMQSIQAVRPVVGPPHYAPAPCKWWRIAVHIFELGGHHPRRWCGSSYSVRIPSLKFVRGLAVAKIYGCFSVTALIGLVTLSFDLSICKWGHGSPVSWASTLSIFSFLRPSLLDLGSSTRQTDRQRSSVYYTLTLWGRGHNHHNNNYKYKYILKPL